MNGMGLAMVGCLDDEKKSKRLKRKEERKTIAKGVNGR